MKKPYALIGLVLAAVLLGTYANHFQNGFHFDDVHTITDNEFVRHVGNIPRFFVNAYLFSVMSRNASYRPVTAVSLTVDYWLGGGYRPFFFHLSTFLWFLVQLVVMGFLFRRIMDLADPHPWNVWTALAAVACYGLHPANAETINYIVQRGDVYNTLGVVASLLWFIAYPAERKRGWYLIPAVLGFLAKAPGLIFPLILLAYVRLFEEDRMGKAASRTIGAFVVTGAGAFLTVMMTPPAFEGGASSGALYRLTQPWVALHYFKSFFLPTELSADTDWTYVTGPFSGEALAGYLFVAGLLAAAFYAARRRETRPIAFGIFWFFLALAPTSLMPLGEVTNDHRMFFPFVGLTLAVFWSLRLLLLRMAANRIWVRGAAAAMIVVMAAEAAGTRERNRVWRTDESLWQDVAIKSPKNGRGLMNCGAAFISHGEYAKALPYLEGAEVLLPNYYFIQINLGIANGELGHDAQAAQHFERGIALAPTVAEPYLYYALWLKSKGRMEEAQRQLEATLRVNKLIMPARHLLIERYASQGNLEALDRMVEETLLQDAKDAVALRYQAERAARSGQITPEEMLHQSAEYCRAGKYEECIAAARRAVALKPDYAEAYNNIAAAYIALERWDEGIQAAQEAVRIKPDYELAKRNLQRGLAGKAGIRVRG